MEWFNCKVDDRSKVVGGAQRVPGHVFPLSIESGLAYIHSIWVPTDEDLQEFPHVFFMSPDIWDASVLDHGVTPALLDEINQEADDSLLLYFTTLFLMILETFNNKWYSTWMCSGIQTQQRLGSILFRLIFMRAIPLNKTGNH